MAGIGARVFFAGSSSTTFNNLYLPFTGVLPWGGVTENPGRIESDVLVICKGFEILIEAPNKFFSGLGPCVYNAGAFSYIVLTIEISRLFAGK